MKYLLMILMSLALTISAAAQKMSCCVSTPSSTAQFSALASDKDFKASHESPGNYVYNEDIGEMIKFKTADGKTASAFEILTPYKTDDYLFIFHEWWGLNDYVKKEAVRYFTELKVVNIIAIDLYDGQIATNPDEAQKYMQGVTDEGARAIIQGALKHIGKQAHVATLGWCFGGMWSLQASIIAGKQAAGCVMFYGMPEKDVEKLKTLQTDVLGIFATKDQWINPDVVTQFQANMKTAGKKLTVQNYNEDHAFANPSNPHYAQVSADDAFKRAKSFLAKQYYFKNQGK
jgi:carboxymethylenebutenolidase